MISTITINSLTIGTVASGYHITKLSGFLYPNVEVNVVERGEYHGAKLDGYRYSRRELGIEIEIIGDDPSDMEDKRIALAKAFSLYSGLSTVTFVTKKGTTLMASAIVRSELGSSYKRGDAIITPCRIELVAPYPFFLGNTLNSEEVPVFDGGGFAIPMELPFDMSAGGSGATTIVNDGNGKAYPIIKIYGICENPTIQNTTMEEALSLTYDLTSISDYIEIDCYNQTVKLNGVTNIRKYASGKFPVIASGNNTFKLTVASSGSGAKAVIEYYDAYLGV